MKHGKPRPYIGQKLRKHRRDQKKYLKEVAKNMEYPRIDYLSQIENGKRSISDEQIVNILIRGYHLRPKQAEQLAGKWILEEAAEKYGIKITVHE